MEELTREACSEVFQFIEVLGEKYKNQIPKDIYDLIRSKYDPDYKKIDFNDDDFWYQLCDEAHDLIIYLDLEYWCTEEEKKKLLEKMGINQSKKDKEINDNLSDDIKSEQNDKENWFSERIKEIEQLNSAVNAILSGRIKAEQNDENDEEETIDEPSYHFVLPFPEIDSEVIVIDDDLFDDIKPEQNDEENNCYKPLTELEQIIASSAFYEDKVNSASECLLSLFNDPEKTFLIATEMDENTFEDSPVIKEVYDDIYGLRHHMILYTADDVPYQTKKKENVLYMEDEYDGSEVMDIIRMYGITDIIIVSEDGSLIVPVSKE